MSPGATIMSFILHQYSCTCICLSKGLNKGLISCIYYAVLKGLEGQITNVKL